MNFYYLKSGLSNGFAVLSKNTSLICDISDGSQKLIRIGCNLFAENYTGELDTYVLTHYHKRHISTFSYFSRFTYISRLCLPEPQNETEQGILQTLCELAGQNGCQVYLYPKNQTAILETEEVTITIPEYSSLKRSSHPVVALTFDILDHKILYTSASAYESSLAGFAQTAAKEASVLIFGTHSPVFKKQIVLEEKNYPLLQLVIFDDAEMRYQVQNDFRFISRYADDPSTKLVLNR